MALSQQVQVLQPLQPKLSTTEVERDTALHKLERLQVGRAQQCMHSRQLEQWGAALRWAQDISSMFAGLRKQQVSCTAPQFMQLRVGTEADLCLCWPAGAP